MTDQSPGTQDIQLFVDYWNFKRALDSEMATYGGKLKVYSPGFGEWLAQQAGLLLGMGDRVQLARANFYTSFNPDTKSGHGHKAQVNRRLRNPALRQFAWIRPLSRKKSPPHCPVCRERVDRCPKCNADMRGYEEKGVDVALAVGMMREAHAGRLDAVVLVSSDRDLIPVVEEIKSIGFPVFHVGFPSGGDALRDRCNGSINPTGGLQHLMD